MKIFRKYSVFKKSTNNMLHEVILKLFCVSRNCECSRVGLSVLCGADLRCVCASRKSCRSGWLYHHTPSPSSSFSNRLGQNVSILGVTLLSPSGKLSVLRSFRKADLTSEATVPLTTLGAHPSHHTARHSRYGHSEQCPRRPHRPRASCAARSATIPAPTSRAKDGRQPHCRDACDALRA